MVTNQQAPEVCALKNQILKYHWGVPGGISKTLGYQTTNTPEAELWIGAHPKAPSQLITAKPAQTLEEFERQSGKKLPYLLKMLAVNEPLSIQAHPTTAQAVAGFAAETAAGIPLHSQLRNYRDQNSKPELIVALESGFSALCGFRNPAESRQLLSALSDTAIAADPKLQNAANRLRTFIAFMESAALQEAVQWALNADPATKNEKQELIAALAALAACFQGVTATESTKALRKLRTLANLIVKLHNAYPYDCGIIVAVLLNQVQLKHGEALWLPPGTPHAYLRGYGIEIMGSSDNVLRGGLTEKHIDPAELAKVLNFTHGITHPFTPVVVGSNYRYNPDPEGKYSNPFELVRVTASCKLKSQSPLSILIVKGSFKLCALESSKQTEIGEKAGLSEVTVAHQGASYLVPAGSVKLIGSGEAYIAAGAITEISGG